MTHYISIISQVTIIDTPGFGENLEDEEDILNNMVNFLKKEVKFVNVFLIAFKESDTRIPNEVRTNLKMLSAMFGPSFWDNVLIEVTRYRFDKTGHNQREDAMGVPRGSTDIWSHMENWKNTIKEKFKLTNENWEDMDAVFIDSYYRSTDEPENVMFLNQTAKLFNFAKAAKPYPMKDIEAVRGENTKFEQQVAELVKEKARLKKELEKADPFRKERDTLKENLTQLEQELENLKKGKVLAAGAKAGEETKMALFGGGGVLLGFLLGCALSSWCWYKNMVGKARLLLSYFFITRPSKMEVYHR